MSNEQQGGGNSVAEQAPAAAPAEQAPAQETNYSDIFNDFLPGQDNGVTEKVETPVVNSVPDPNAQVIEPAQTETPPVQQPQLTPEQIAAQNNQALAQDQAFTQALTQHYKLPEEVRSHFSPEQAGVIENAGVMIHRTVRAQLLQELSQLVPQVFQQQMSQVNKVSEVKTQFSSMYPKIDEKNSSHVNQVMVVGQLINKQFPNYTNAQRLKAIGDLVYQTLGLQNDGTSQNNSPQQNGQFPNARSMGAGASTTNSNQNQGNVFASIFDDLTER